MIQDDSSAVSSSQWSTEDGLSSIDASVSSSEKEMPDIYAAIGKTAMQITALQHVFNAEFCGSIGSGKKQRGHSPR